MPYIGNNVPAHFQSPPAVQRFSGDNSTTVFTLTTSVSTVQDVIVSVNGVVQDTSAYTIPNGTSLTFTEAPSTGSNNIFVYYVQLSGGSITPAAENKGNFKLGGLFRTNSKNVSTNTTILATENANATGPITIDSGVTLTIESGARFITL